jgi:hypothetical protein
MAGLWASSIGIRSEDQIGEVLHVRERTPNTAPSQQSSQPDQTIPPEGRAGSPNRLAAGVKDEQI